MNKIRIIIKKIINTNFISSRLSVFFNYSFTRRFFLLFPYIYLNLISKQNIKSKNKILLIKLDSLGDVILFIPFLKHITEHSHYNKYTIDILLNDKNKGIEQLFELYKIKVNIQWINYSKFIDNKIYFLQFLYFINNKGYEILINTLYSRNIWPVVCNYIVKFTTIPTKIGFRGDTHLVEHLHKGMSHSASYYNILINNKPEVIFEWERNLELTNSLFNENINLKDIISPIQSMNITYNKYFVLFIGAGVSQRKWDINNFLRLVQYLSSNYNNDIIILGGSEDCSNAEKLKIKENVHNYCGKTSIYEYYKYISESKLLISNESSAVHIAALLNKPYICISDGNHYKRFHPYPKDIITNNFYCYPSEISMNSDQQDLLSEWYKGSSHLNINEIDHNTIIKMINRLNLQ